MFPLSLLQVLYCCRWSHPPDAYWPIHQHRVLFTQIPSSLSLRGREKRKERGRCGPLSSAPHICSVINTTMPRWPLILHTRSRTREKNYNSRQKAGGSNERKSLCFSIWRRRRVQEIRNQNGKQESTYLYFHALALSKTRIWKIIQIWCIKLHKHNCAYEHIRTYSVL